MPSPPRPSAQPSREGDEGFPASLGPSEGHESDHRLAQAALGGDETAVRQLIARLGFVPRVLSVLNARTGRRLDEHDLSDLTQDVVILLWRKLGSFELGSKIETWSYGVARLEFMNALRRKRRTHPSSQRAGADPVEDTTEALDAALDNSEIYAALDELPADEARVIRRKILDDLTFDEIGDADGTSANTIKTRYYRGLSRLAHRLRGRLGEEEQP